MIFLFIYNNSLQAIRVDYSKGDNIFAFKKYFNFKQYLGYYSSKLSSCINPQFMQSTYVNTTIKYTSEEKSIIKQISKPYILEKDIARVISCADDAGNNINYIPKILEIPQCLVDLMI